MTNYAPDHGQQQKQHEQRRRRTTTDIRQTKTELIVIPYSVFVFNLFLFYLISIDYNVFIAYS